MRTPTKNTQARRRQAREAAANELRLAAEHVAQALQSAQPLERKVTQRIANKLKSLKADEATVRSWPVDKAERQAKKLPRDLAVKFPESWRTIIDKSDTPV